MKSEQHSSHLRHLPAAVLLALIVQGGTVVWWASAKDREGAFLERRVAVLETRLSQSSDGEEKVLERLARIEERVNAQTGLLERIEKQIVTSHK